ncbi:hypothetical protein [Paraflavitalea speifideaquila]|uniref:hypothetical protein n=1 Tax=Paraflavitalea speifideaquila TaxID=3076558 RepID=UPI0028ED6D23|nr:hypothetical protein [Paraflavitalea speifideiaquila]
MAKVLAGPGAGFQGSIDGLSFYKIKGLEGTYVRKKGGPSREQYNQAPGMINTRRGCTEFGGRATASKWIMRALKRHKPLADHNIAGPLNALLRSIQALDGEHSWGQRSVCLSANPQILKGFSLNRNNHFDTTIRYPIEYVLDKEMGAASVDLPALIPGINFFAPEKYPWFSIIISLGIVPDIVFTKNHEPLQTKYDAFTDPEAKSNICKYGYTDKWYALIDSFPVTYITTWQPVKKGMAATTLELVHPFLTPPLSPPDEHFSLVLSIGIGYGIQVDADTIQQAPYAGAAKVLAVV